MTEPFPLPCNPELKKKIELDALPRVTTSCADAVRVCEDIAAGKDKEE